MQAIDPKDLKYSVYSRIEEIEPMIKMIESELSEPYSIFTYRYFLQNWPNLCFLVFNSLNFFIIAYIIIQAYYNDEIIGCIIGKLDKHGERLRGFFKKILTLFTNFIK